MALAKGMGWTWSAAVGFTACDPLCDNASVERLTLPFTLTDATRQILKVALPLRSAFLIRFRPVFGFDALGHVSFSLLLLAGMARWERLLRAGGAAGFCFVHRMTDTLRVLAPPKNPEAAKRCFKNRFVI
jgi:hypothetical protein